MGTSKTNTHPCKECAKRFNSKTSLKDHVKAVHVSSDVPRLITKKLKSDEKGTPVDIAKGDKKDVRTTRKNSKDTKEINKDIAGEICPDMEKEIVDSRDSINSSEDSKKVENSPQKNSKRLHKKVKDVNSTSGSDDNSHVDSNHSNYIENNISEQTKNPPLEKL